MKKRRKFYLLYIFSSLKLKYGKKFHLTSNFDRIKEKANLQLSIYYTKFYNQLPPYTANCQAALTYIEMDQDTNLEQTVIHPTER